MDLDADFNLTRKQWAPSKDLRIQYIEWYHNFWNNDHV